MLVSLKPSPPDTRKMKDMTFYGYLYQPINCVPIQPQKIISGLKKTFVKRYVVERTTKVDIRPQEQSEKADSCRENLWKEIQLKGP